jgi:putative DNA methylase
MTYKKKLIEVALPLEAINKESAREKSIRHGHPSTLHLWWARRPLAACRAVLFASLVDDPSAHPEQFPSEEDQEKERRRLFSIIEDLVKWENTTEERVLSAAREEIMKSTDNNPPPVLDPFCGGGSIPLEAQRLGLEAHGSDLNPVAVLITKALIEIPPKFANQPPVHPRKNNQLQNWVGARGLAEDIRYYGQWMRQEAEKRIGHLYPKVKITEAILQERPDLKDQNLKSGDELTVIAWLWARTVKCPNPACVAQMPLVRSFWISKRKAKEVWVQPIIDTLEKTINFKIRIDEGNAPEGTVSRNGAQCIFCNHHVPLDHIRSEGKAKRMGVQMMAIVVEGKKGRVYLPPIMEHKSTADFEKPQNIPDSNLPEQALGFRVQLYGIKKHQDLFTPRQLVALTTFSDLVSKARESVIEEAQIAVFPNDDRGLDEGGTGAIAYADAVATYLAFLIDKQADLGNALNRWEPVAQCPRQLFGRQAIPMVWDFAEGNPLGNSSGSWSILIDNLHHSLNSPGFIFDRKSVGMSLQLDATAAISKVSVPLISTDPPYYDNIGYADLSDFFYIWLRRSLKDVYPNLFSTLMVPKNQELVADPHRFGGDKEKSRKFFESGAIKAFSLMCMAQNTEFPMTVYYAFKQSEIEGIGKENKVQTTTAVSTGWETMLEGLLTAGLSVTATWPTSTECRSRMRGQVSNALASSIVIVCRPRPESAPMATRREFISALKTELPEALKNLQHGNIAPVDLAQAAIGPGMSVFSRYAKVIEADGKPMTVRTALQIINQALDEYLTEQEGDMDQDTRFCVAWFEQFGLNEGPFGEADVLARAKNTSVRGLEDAGVAVSKGGKLKLLSREEYPQSWDPAKDKRLTVWECTQHLIRRLNTGGEQGAAELAGRLGSGRSEEARALAYRLYSICERKNWAKQALDYNSLVIAWPEIITLAQEPYLEAEPGRLF